MNIYSSDSELLAAGAKKYQLGTAWCWYAKIGGRYDFSRVDVEAIDRACINSQYGYPFVIDIEHFDVKDDFDNAIRNLRRALIRWKSNQPERLIGYYGIMPVRDYWCSLTAATYRDRGQLDQWKTWSKSERRWSDHNTLIANDLLEGVDFLVPSIYALYPGNEARWREYADANLREAERIAYGKPLWPMLMPSYKGRNPIEAEKWQGMIEFAMLHPASDALSIHSHPGYACNPNWREPVKTALVQAASEMEQ